MKRILLAASLLVTASSAFAEWKLADSNEERDLYLDVSRIKIEVGSVKYWTLLSYKANRNPEGTPHRSTLFLYEVDCQNENFRVLSVSHRSETMGHGKVTLNSNINGSWSHIVPGSLPDVMLQNSCLNRQ